MSRDRSDHPGGQSTPECRTREPPPGVAARMAVLRASYIPETVAAAAERLAHEGPAARELPFEVAVARRLQELRALLELAAYLHRAPDRVAPRSNPASAQGPLEEADADEA